MWEFNTITKGLKLCRALEGTDGSAGRPHDMEVARLQVSLDAVELDAKEEARACAQLTHTIIHRLDSSRRAVERLLGILQVTLKFQVKLQSFSSLDFVHGWHKIHVQLGLIEKESRLMVFLPPNHQQKFESSAISPLLLLWKFLVMISDWIDLLQTLDTYQLLNIGAMLQDDLRWWNSGFFWQHSLFVLGHISWLLEPRLLSFP